ncbi:hypothetical protein QBC38DRAFT_506644 [Podospora fimiseda]|uniref:Uncharacterized protein n=1 Tax=Podospora fimiseda TaxID=252190 RepID=A0AAN7BYZ1_9PEZI|nr:hypothetical protein QBC38DRAFT_506644 [Podospora fimiseda]
MPTSGPQSVTLPRKRRLGLPRRVLTTLLLAMPNLVLTGPTTSFDEECRVTFLLSLLPENNHHLKVSYASNKSFFKNPTLSLWCGGVEGRKASLKYRTNHDLNPKAGNVEVKLDFLLLSNIPCWFEITSTGSECGDANRSDAFLVVSHSTIESILLSIPPSSPADLKVRQETNAGAGATTETSLPAPTATGDIPPWGGGVSSPGAKAAIGVSVTAIILIIIAMSAFLFLRRRRKESELAGAIVDHERRAGRKGHEKRNHPASSIASGGSEEPLYPPIIQPVFDGYPGSMGYDDPRPLHSSLTNSHSPIHGPDSPTSFSNGGGGFWGSQTRSVESEELAAARLKTKQHTTLPTVVSYGPNPVTPTLTPRPSSRVELNKRAASNSPDSIEAIPHVPHIPDYIPDYANYSIPPPNPTPSPPRKPALPIVVSYGPNRVTPTPAVVSPTVPPDDAIVSRRYQDNIPSGGGTQQNNNSNDPPYQSHDRRYSWEPESPLLGSSNNGPLPPYASTAEFEAMEKGAVRKWTEPQAEAELPPTKDGFYHGYGAPELVEYELPGAAPQNEPQLPFHPYKPQARPPGGGGGYMEIEEQKFLLDDLLSVEDIRKLKEEKARQKEKREKEMREARERGEEYDLGETMGFNGFWVLDF